VSVRITWHGEELKRAVQAASAEGLIRAGTFLHTAARAAVNKSNPRTRSNKQIRAKGGKLVRSKVKGYFSPSKPGEPPRARTGHGRDGVVFEFNDNRLAPAVRVGVRRNAIYMYYLEMGTNVISPRPWLVATMMKNRQTLALLAATGGKGKIPNT